MPQYPDPWIFSNRDECLHAPNGSARLLYEGLKSLAAGAPLSGKCNLLSTNSKILLGNEFGGPPAWSANSSYVAIPRWISSFGSNNLQKIYVLCIGDFTIAETFEEFRVVHLLDFSGSMIRGIDSPNYRTNNIEINIWDLVFRPFELMDWNR